MNWLVGEKLLTKSGGDKNEGRSNKTLQDIGSATPFPPPKQTYTPYLKQVNTTEVTFQTKKNKINAIATKSLFCLDSWVHFQCRVDGIK